MVGRGAEQERGADNDSLQQVGGTTITMNGDEGADTLLSQGGATITMNGGADADSLQQVGGTTITMNGGADDDRYVLAGAAIDGVKLIETHNAGVDTVDFSSFTGGGIAFDLGMTSLQTLTPGKLTVTLSHPQGFENVVGTAFADVIFGNNQDNRLLGGSTEPDDEHAVALEWPDSGRLPRLRHAHQLRRARLHCCRTGGDRCSLDCRFHRAQRSEPVVPLPVHPTTAHERRVRDDLFQPAPSGARWWTRRLCA